MSRLVPDLENVLQLLVEEHKRMLTHVAGGKGLVLQYELGKQQAGFRRAGFEGLPEPAGQRGRIVYGEGAVERDVTCDQAAGIDTALLCRRSQPVHGGVEIGRQRRAASEVACTEVQLGGKLA